MEGITMSERLNELYILTQKAQKMERINEEIALDIYLEIFENYQPIISKTYESAIRLLEKRHRYQEALQICERAIEGIKNDEMSGLIEKFENNKDRIVRKMAAETPEEPISEKKTFHFNINYKVAGIALVVILVIIGIFRLSQPYDDLNVNLDGKEAIDGGDQIFDESKEGPDADQNDYQDYVITDSMISIATTEGKRYTEVDDITLSAQEENIGLGILVTLGTSETKAKEIAITTLKSLAGAASAEYKDLKSPSINQMGGLYDYYEVIVTVGYGTDEDSFIVKGTKSRGSSEMYWRSDN